MTPPDDVIDRINALPLGSSHGRAFGKTYVATRSTFSDGRAIKVVAEATDGSDYISLNLYDLTAGPQLYPCEMPAEKVIDFLRSFQPSGTWLEQAIPR